MKWYVAHVIMYVKFKDGVQDSYPIWENLYLIKASSPAKAWEKAHKYGREAEGIAAVHSPGALGWQLGYMRVHGN